MGVFLVQVGSSVVSVSKVSKLAGSPVSVILNYISCKKEGAALLVTVQFIATNFEQ